ncbi:acyl-CoA dehydrogenase family protein [Nocardiopsis kunsanensis]|uniref:acyl-CoA dehydrogenase n=1 Tax=Nocardiopsis kunsanensis TaxID=141693 RepID=UPI00047801FB|nr:acyl-CoA dehydrogenase [Nocardiopsis kunsanensis]
MSTVGTARTRVRNAAGTGSSAHRYENGQNTSPATRALLREIESGGLDIPLPGSGDTWLRWQTLIRLGTEDLSLARLAEGHVDALAILAELGDPPPSRSAVWGVWAAHPPGYRLRARPLDTGWVLEGSKPFCSGARTCTRALVSAEPDSGERLLFTIENKHTIADPGTWAAAGMSDSETCTVDFRNVRAVRVGAPNAYTDRPGFHHGGAGVAACWYGGALAVAEPLAAKARRQGTDPHTLAHFGAVVRDLRCAEDVLRRAAREIDEDPDDAEGRAAERALLVRSAVVSSCTSVLQHCAEALGAGPLASDPAYTRAAQDLSVYIRQHHGDRDLARLGESAAHEHGRDRS